MYVQYMYVWIFHVHIDKLISKKYQNQNTRLISHISNHSKRILEDPSTSPNPLGDETPRGYKNKAHCSLAVVVRLVLAVLAPS